AATIATVVKGGVAARELGTVLDPARRWAILVGSEAHGLSDDEVAAADVQVTIPMPGGTESLNAAVAGAIVAYELALWRNAAGGVISNR
ncbi:MAG: TrmH family RNA methyltransferase, partial [Acidimicrobiia bacterium]